MKNFELLTQKINIDTQKISIGIIELHNESREKKLMLSIGMLDLKIIEATNEIIEKSIKSKFDDVINCLFEPRINDFIRDCQSEVIRGIYSNAKMFV